MSTTRTCRTRWSSTPSGREVAERIRALTLAVYARAEVIARDRGIVLADTKLEFGRRPDGTIVLADEVLTPDSSRFWDAEAWERGVLDSYDKQYVRNWLLHDSGWDRHGGEAPPALPDEVVAATRERYLQAYERLTGDPVHRLTPSGSAAAGDGDAVDVVHTGTELRALAEQRRDRDDRDDGDDDRDDRAQDARR